MKSEFGRGLCYNLGLFLAHAERIESMKIAYKAIPHRMYSMWFYSAADHLYDFQPESAPKHLRKRCGKFMGRVLSLRLPLDEEKEAVAKDYEWAIQEAKNLLRLIDKAHGVKTQKGCWE